MTGNLILAFPAATRAGSYSSNQQRLPALQSFQTGDDLSALLSRHCEPTVRRVATGHQSQGVRKLHIRNKEKLLSDSRRKDEADVRGPRIGRFSKIRYTQLEI